MKYRKTPEDFIVQELANHKLVRKGDFKLYTLEKEGMETVALIDLLSRTFQIPRKELGIAGIKDTHAKTKQYITVPSHFDIKSVNNINIKFLGFINYPLRLGDLDANKFIITVKDIEEQELDFIEENAETVEDGFPNYYDTQRFGSVIDNKFIGKYLVEKNYEAAVKQYLTGIYRNDSDELIRDKDNIYNAWPAFDTPVKDHNLRQVIFQYQKTKKWISAFKYIPMQLRLLFISAYQSHLWNECIKTLLETKAKNEDLYTVPFVLGELVFNKKPIADLPETFQTISHRVKPQAHEQAIIDEVLKAEGVELKQFNIRQTGNFFKSQERAVMLYPTEFVMHEPVRTGNTYAVTVEFVLPKGCYATMVLKKIFEQ